MGLHLIEDEQSATRASSRTAHAKLQEAGVDVHLSVEPEAGPRVGSLRGAELHRALATALPGGGAVRLGASAGRD